MISTQALKEPKTLKS